jgi:hypothetical protein
MPGTEPLRRCRLALCQLLVVYFDTALSSPVCRAAYLARLMPSPFLCAPEAVSLFVFFVRARCRRRAAACMPSAPLPGCCP